MDELLERYTAIPQKQRFLIVALIIGGMIALYYYMVYDGQQANFAALTKKFQDRQQVKNSKQNIAQNRQQYEKKLGELQQSLDDAKAKLPDDADVAQLLAQLGSRGSEVGLRIQEFQPMPENVHEFYAAIPFQMRVEGGYHEIGMFLDSVAKLDRIINVTELTMTKPTTDNGKVKVSGQFTLTSYRFVPEKKK